MEGSLRTHSRKLDGFLKQKPPHEVFHYTNTAGFFGIIRSSSLWATNLQYMDDFSELKYGRELISEVFEKSKSKLTDQCSEEFFGQIELAVRTVPKLNDAFGVCFCEDGNLLSQWRTYAQEGTGFSIGFQSEKLKDLSAKGAQPFLIKVLYDSNEQRNILNEVFDGLSKCRASEKALVNLEMALHLCLTSFKQNCFEEENEWRLVCLLGHQYGNRKYLEFRNTEAAIVPYLPIGPSPEAKLPIPSVYLGPQSGLSEELSVTSVYAFLARYEYHQVTLLGSGIPLRSRKK